MIGQAVPLFKAGNLLTKEMLGAIKDYAFDFGELLFHGYSDGILSGCEITTTENTLQLNTGIIVYGGRLYLIREPLVESYYPTDIETVFKLKMKDEIKTQSFIYREFEAFICSSIETDIDELELCRFKLQKGFKLRTDYQSFGDRNTEYDTVNVIYAPYASYGEASISTNITRDFARYLNDSGSQNPLDFVFCMQAFGSNGFAMNREGIITYLVGRLGLERKAYSNIEIFRYLNRILGEISHVEEESFRTKGRGRRVLLD